MVIGVLALQGDSERHRRSLAAAGLESVDLRHASELGTVDGLVLPGGESTTMLKFFEGEPWEAAIRAFDRSGRPILATCAGLILLARSVSNPPQRSLDLLDVDVVRNAYGRQADSFVGRARGAGGFDEEAVFIRAPKITRVGTGVEVLARTSGDPVLVRQRNVFGASFHPELSAGSRLHREIFAATASPASR